MDEAALIARAQRGDQVALANLLQMHYLTVKKYLVTVTFDRSLAEDLTQETVIRAIQRIGQFGGRSKFSTWLISIATNLYLDWLRKEKRQQRVLTEAGEALRMAPTTTEQQGAVDEMLVRVQELPRDVSLPLIMKHYYGYTYEEIAEVMAIPAGTVKSRIFNGIRALRRGLADE